MRLPKERLGFKNTVDGKVEPGGFLVLDLKGLDIEGVTTLVISAADLEAARSAGDRQAEARERARALFGD